MLGGTDRRRPGEVQGRRAVLAGKLQARYGRSQEEVEVEINRFLLRAERLLKL